MKLPPELEKFLGRPCTCTTWHGEAGYLIRVVDWNHLDDQESILGKFEDCELGRDYKGLIAESDDGEIVWVSTTMLPVALLGLQDGGDGQLDAILLIDVAKPVGPVYAIEVDGTAIPARKPKQVAAKVADLAIRAIEKRVSARGRRAGRRTRS